MSFLRHRMLRSTVGIHAVQPTGFDIANFSYDGVSLSLVTQDTSNYGMAFNSTGTKLYFVGAENRLVYQYTLLTGFDLSTASYDNLSFDVSAQDTLPLSIAFNQAGTKLFLMGGQNTEIYQYTLTTGFDLSTASYDGTSFNVSGQEIAPSGLRFNNEGTKLFVIGPGSDSVHQYSLGTGFNISTASYDNVFFSVVGQETTPRALAFNSDGTKLLVVGNSNDTVYQYSLATAFDISTTTYDSTLLSVSGQDTNPYDIVLTPDDNKLFMVGNSNDAVYQYSSS